jgi:acyl-CoA dehydrogenase
VEPDPQHDLQATAAAFRQWLAANPARLEPFRGEIAEELEPAIARFRPLQRLLWDAGWMRLGWPAEVGGLGGLPAQRFAVAEQLAAAGYVIPEILGTVEIIAPMLLRYAPHLAARHVAPAMRGDEVWCQGFSEPDAGSDLGALRTRAVPDGDGYRITGQKMWSSFGTVAQWACVLARTGEADSGYRGLTMVWVDLTDPGVKVVGTRCESGRMETAEVFFDDVYVPSERLIGAPGQGWAVVMYLMQFERGAYAWGRQATLHTELEQVVRHRVGDGSGDLPADAAAVVGDAYLALFALRSLGRETIVELTSGHDLGPEISIDKILLSTAEQTMTEAVRRLLFPRVELADDRLAEWWRARWVFSRITTIYGGAAEVQRDLVAERLLGLPRDRVAR